jgi:hypothetical protein
MLECWNVGMLECWNVGMLECWNVGMLECWKAEQADTNTPTISGYFLSQQHFVVVLPLRRTLVLSGILFCSFQTWSGGIVAE